ncbi:DMT family transporter [Anaeroselena agilis]|uniref:DMT family transporter n=1 Tax=Anaeroselena agilis TaxID=3063788 RepID=A0ABU3NXD8_9FIRM|nr:DMT family transporter [Selenomonadales bacterium 4137-cl]
MLRFLLHTERGVLILLTLTAVMWGGNAVTAKYVVGELPPVTTAFFRFAWVSAILLTLAWRVEGAKCLPERRQLPGILAMAATGIFGHNFLVYSGVKLSTATNMSLFAAVNPVITACLAAVFLHERLTGRQMLGVALSLMGVVTVITRGDASVLTGLSFNFGDILLAAAPVAWAVYSVVGRRVMRGMSALAATAWASLAGTALLLAAALWEGFDGAIALSTVGWAGMTYMIIGSGVIAFYWWNQGVTVVGPSRAAIFMNLIPLSGMFLAAVLLHESISAEQAAGAAMIIGGVWLTTQRP